MPNKDTNDTRQFRRDLALLGALARRLLFILSLTVPCQAVNSTNFSYRFNLWNEATVNGIHSSSPFNPDNMWLHLPAASNLFQMEGEASYAFGQQVKIAGGFYNRYEYNAGSHDRIRLKELYMNWSIGAHWDLAAGKKILRWGTGYAWTPTGVLDPQRDPRDPADRLSQYEGNELIEFRGTFGSKSITGVYSSPHLFSRLQSRRDGQLAVKYSALFRKLDYSIIASFGGSRQANRYGANATYVLGQALELHGEFIAQRSSLLSYPLAIAQIDAQVTFPYTPYAPLKENDRGIYLRALVGANYTFPTGWNLVVEYYRDGQGLSEIERQRFDSFVLYNEEQQRLSAGGDQSMITLPAANLLWTLQGIVGFNRARDYFFARVSSGLIARRWSFENIAIFSLRDGSSIWIPEASYDFSERIGVYLRYSYYAGNRTAEFGSLPWRSTLNLGLAFRF